MSSSHLSLQNQHFSASFLKGKAEGFSPSAQQIVFVVLPDVEFIFRPSAATQRFAVGQLLNVVQSGGDAPVPAHVIGRSEEHTSELQSRENLVCRLLLEKKKKTKKKEVLKR